jgi:two-component system, chemotaxis family, chemotaxis protein CheY
MHIQQRAVNIEQDCANWHALHFLQMRPSAGVRIGRFRSPSIKAALTRRGQDSRVFSGQTTRRTGMAVNRAKAQSAEPRTSIVGRPVGQSPIARRTFGKDVPALDLGSISLLVINDNEFVRTYMERLFSIMRVGSVVTCNNPRSARAEIATVQPDIVVIDLDLTGVDGLQLLHDIRHGGAGIPSDIAILVASAHVDRDYVGKAREAGANWILVKPLTFRRLYEGLVNVIMDERTFVEGDVYVGPDRRVLVGMAGYDGVERRKERQP